MEQISIRVLNSPNAATKERQERAIGFTSRERQATDLSGIIQGWGADLDPVNRPGVPKDKEPYVGIETLYPEIEMQLSETEILSSTEHRQMPPVFGTSCPPSGLSGQVRRFAFRYSEGALTHWFALLFADRLNVVEDLLKDLASGHIPNLYKEMGLSNEWKYNRKAVLKKAAMAGIGVAAVTAGIVALKKRSRPAQR